MGKSQPSPPPAPNPVDTARASTSTNVATAITNAFLNNTNQNTPDGSLRYDQTDTYNWVDPYTGTNISIPRFTATQTLSPAQQAIQDQGNTAKVNLAGLAANQSDRLSKLLGSEINLGNAPDAGQASSITGIPQAATTFGDVGQQQSTFDQSGAASAGNIQSTYGPSDNFSADRQNVQDALMARINPQLAVEKDQLTQQLADQGIRYGSQAYQSAMDNYNRQSNDARFSAIGQAGQEQQRMMDMAAQKAGFQNAAQQQAYTQSQQTGQFANQAQQENFRQAGARADYSNAGLAQQVAQAQTGFNAENMARNQYMNEQYALRNQPINEISSLLSGSQINNPNFVNTPNNQIPTTDVAGLINNRFSQDMSIYQQESQNYNQQQAGMYGMIGGILGGGLGLMKSDVREKENITKVGSILRPHAIDTDDRGGGYKPMKKDADELPIYSYSFKKDPTGARRFGPMAQDVEKIDPTAVLEHRGIKYINKAKLGSVLGMA
jgi:hypothetical protein